MLLILNVVSSIDAPFREDKSAMPVLLIVFKLSCVSVAAWESDHTIAVHLVEHPVALVHAAFWEPGAAVAMSQAIQLVTLVLELGYRAAHSDSWDVGSSMRHRNRAVHKLKAIDQVEGPCALMHPALQA